MVKENKGVVVHVFNPEHDLALAFGSERFTPPAAGRGMRDDLAFLPAIWAEKGDIVLVDQVPRAREMAAPWQQLMADVVFVARDDKKTLRNIDRLEVKPWGWNLMLWYQLLKSGVDADSLPSREQIEKVRELSHRATTIPLLEKLTQLSDGIVGERRMAISVEEVGELAHRWGHIVLKAPWSSSGRGVRFVDLWPGHNMEGYLRNVMAKQGGIVVEPCYDKDADFAMEFMADGQGKAEYCGLSLFHTVNGAYVGNLLATEEEKRQMLERRLDPVLIEHVAQMLATEVGKWCEGCYKGPFGVDMMVVRHPQGYAMHPCVEVNLRRTMGHVALDVARKTRGTKQLMRVAFEHGLYKLHID